MKVVAIVQARMGSTRFPNKMMAIILGKPMIELLLSRLSKSSEIDEVVVATSIDPNNQVLADHVTGLGYNCFRGSEEDVLERYVGAARAASADIVVRITGDCPLIDPILVDETILAFKNSGAHYLSNSYPPTYPDGLDTEVFLFAALEQASADATDVFQREHVTPYIRDSGKFEVAEKQHEHDLSGLRWTVDEFADFSVITSVFEHFSPDIQFRWQDILALEKSQPELFQANKHMTRNQGAVLGKGQKLWKRAKRVIPGGNMLLSKRAEMFLPEFWPSYYSKAKGARIWDLDGKEYQDMSLMGIGTNTLGYAHPEVDEAVRKAVENGNMSTLNCPEEVYLAEKLLELHPWADMARFARSGGEANAIAIRIARAASGRDKVAICGYHGWHDWYLSANLNDDENLTGHLLPGLQAAGIPKNLQGTVLPFNYNKFDELEALVNQHDIGVIKMEVARSQEPRDDFLKKIRTLATEKNIVLIFDECTSGFRQTFGGLHKMYDVEPDMAVFGKALGNGYAVTATIGRREIMEAAQSTFISSTFWTERIGSAAGLKTLEIMERERSWEQITNKGYAIRKGWANLAAKHELSIEHSGLPALCGYSFKYKNAQAYKTLVTQEMLKKGWLATNSVYVCTEHTPDIIAEYLDALDPIFEMVRKCEDGADISSMLDGPVSHTGFSRLN